ncbi:hypothetical protein GA0070614_5089 [Micromonospora coxensis]|uniref:Oligosaccharide repeat unit polymerase n=2 Tax=Micromonospora coxensis TaxID=356852 RepID=A0A1C5JQL1_9ACTN|nr:hypothetical protein GA0070614_5089 [Micromonospora coxensis]
MTSLVLAGFDPRLRHWMLIPVTLCGLLIGVDAIEWFRRRSDVFDPQAIVGLCGFHFFYLAPILHVMLDYWAFDGLAPADWRKALGSFAVLNAVGLLVYRMILPVARPAAALRRKRTRTELSEEAFCRTGVVACGLGIMAFLAEVYLFGGLDGFLSVMTENRETLTGMGWLLVVGESFPLIATLVVLVRWRHVLRRRRALLVLIMAALFATQFFVAGMRGSRIGTLWPMIAALMVIHLLVVRITQRTVAVLALVFVVFMYSYGLYKGSGVEALGALKGQRSVSELAKENRRDLPYVLLSDLGRSDVQARILHSIGSGSVRPAYGSTYLHGSAFLVPRYLLPERPEGTKVAVGTDITYGSGAYQAGYRSSRVYGVAGEGVMNFGALGGITALVVFGFLVRFARRFWSDAIDNAGLAVKILAPSVVLVVVNMLMWDFDNTLWFIVKHVVPTFVVLWVASLSRAE